MITGSTGRYRDFTRTFLPKSDLNEDRWRRIDDIAHSNTGFPPIEVYKVGDVYFVSDGNHRVSVARMHKAQTIEAYVIEYKTSVPLDKQDDLDDIILKMEQTEFFKDTRLAEIQPEQDVLFTEPGRYRLVKEHIAFHKYLREMECGCEISYEEAVESWYHNVYMPIIQLIREREVLKHFPGRTEADLYGWLILHRAALEEEFSALGQVPTEDIVEDLKRKNSANPLVQLINLFQPTKLDSMPLKVEKAKFFQETQLDRLRLEQDLDFTEADYYGLVKEHISFHKHLKEIELSQAISYQEAVISWYDNVYRPLVDVIRERKLLKHFPNHTEADLYIWLILRRAALEAELDALGRIPNEEIVRDLEQETKTGPIARLARFFQERIEASISLSV